jgi:putative thioredoxin
MSLIGGATPPSSAPRAGANGGGDPVTEGSDRGFRDQVLQASMTTPVVVDFWAPWCGPCRQLGPAIEAAVRKAKGAVKLVKINIDENPVYAGQLRVQSIPAVIAFDKGRPVDGFVGALPPSEVEAFIKRLAGGGPDPAQVEALLARAQESLEAGDAGGAAQDFASVLQISPDNAAAVAGLARCYLASGDADQARELLDMVPPEKANDPAIQGVRAALALQENAVGGDEIAMLVADVSRNSRDHEKRFKLAQALAARGDLQAAADHLLQIITTQRDWNEGAARAELLKVFEAAGPTSALTKDGRRKLSAILFS